MAICKSRALARLMASDLDELRELGVFPDALRDGFNVCRTTLYVLVGELKSFPRGGLATCRS